MDAEIVGTFALLIMDNLGHMGSPSAIVEDIAVDPAFHRKGIGRQMLQFAMGKAARAGCYKLTLSAASHRDNAHRFYEFLGFEQHGVSFIVSVGDLQSARMDGTSTAEVHPVSNSV